MPTYGMSPSTSKVKAHDSIGKGLGLPANVRNLLHLLVITFLHLAIVSLTFRGLVKLKKIQKSEKNSKVAGWVKRQLRLYLFFGNFVFFYVFAMFSCFQMFPQKIENWIPEWMGGV